MAIIFGTFAPDTLTGGAEPDEIYGFDGDDSLIGGAGADTMVGGAGVDTMTGGDGFDTYYVDDSRDVIVENGVFGGGLVITSADYSLEGIRSINEMRATPGTAPINLTGNNAPETLIGNDGANRINSGPATNAGTRDLLYGLSGDDTYIVYGSNNVVLENAGQGNDLVLFAFDVTQFGTDTRYSLNDLRAPDYHAEVETLAMADAADTRGSFLEGNAFAQTLIGNAGANTLNGRGGVDTLIGLGGDDSYVLDGTQPDIVVEAVGGGVDTVSTSNSYALAAGVEVEILRLTGLSGDLTGNEFSQQLIGSNEANILNGLGGADTMIGQGGNDQYLVRGPGDQVIEGHGGGIDTVFTTVSYSLGVNEVEVLSTVTNADTTPIDLIGNFATQTVVGNFGNNVLNGGSGGIDTLIGLRGNDVYAVGDSRTTIVENANEGSDTVVVAVDYTLAAGTSVEVLAAQNRSATTALNLKGNDVAQTIAGNDGANTIDGGGAADVLIGGGGTDRFAFTTALGSGNVDTIVDFAPGTDTIALAQGIFGVAGVNAINFTTGSAATSADHRIVYNGGTGQLFYDADGNGAGAAIQFATITPGLAIGVGNFEVIGG